MIVHPDTIITLKCVTCRWNIWLWIAVPVWRSSRKALLCALKSCTWMHLYLIIYIYRLYNIGALISRWYTSFKKKWVAMVLEWPSHIHSMQHQSSAVLPVCNMRTQQRICRYCIAFSWLNAWIHLEDRMTWYPNDCWALRKLAFSTI